MFQRHSLQSPLQKKESAPKACSSSYSILYRLDSDGKSLIYALDCEADEEIVAKIEVTVCNLHYRRKNLLQKPVQVPFR